MIKLTTIRNMCSSVNYNRILQRVFDKCVESVKPKSLFNVNKIELVSPSAVRVGDEFIDIKNRKCHLVGFGKAVLGMAVQMERVLGDSLVSGILSVPVGTNKTLSMDKSMQLHDNSVIKVYEGAKNNLPDADAETTARKIFKYAERLTENDVLFVLISGGGSALLPMPTAPITLNEKIGVIKMLASRGANINELNRVRIEISSSKGGKLALAAQGAHKIVSLVISDICGDPLHLIASGPTLIQKSEKERAKQILEKYDLVSSVPESIKNCLANSILCQDVSVPKNNSSVHIIGNNTLAINVAVQEMNKVGIRAICMSKIIEGDVELLSSIYCKLAEAIYKLTNGQLNQTTFKNVINSLDETLMFEKNLCDQLYSIVMDKTNQSPICLVFGGETTVNIKGNGVGGRNQELALRIANNIKNNETISDIVFLSAGTDGIDGPCEAAGGIASLQLVNDCSKYRYGSIDSYIENNDSYSFFKNLSNGKYHIVTGHTGTNVMDLHFMIIPLMYKSYCKM